MVNRDFAILRDPCLKIRDRDSNVHIESKPETLPVKNPSPRLKKLLSRAMLNIFGFMVRRMTKNGR